ncbi:MAG TPA: PKD domain-containing protein [Vicinamibacteria bacterium]|jgi:PKD repeat protein
MQNCARAKVYSILISGFLALSLSRCNDSPIAASDVGEEQQAPGGGGSPVACFSTEPDPPEVLTQQPLTLDASCSGNAAGASFEWDFGDGRTGTGQRVEHRYRRSGEYSVTLNVRTDGGASEATEQITVRQGPTQPPPTEEGPTSCFVFHQVLENDPEPCTVAFDATCSEGSLVEYRWFFEGGPRPDLPLPDTNIVTAEPSITYSWGRDEECFTFRPFDRIVRLTVVDENGDTDVHEETVVFTTPILKQ